MKRKITLLCVLILILSMTVPVMAEESDLQNTGSAEQISLGQIGCDEEDLYEAIRPVTDAYEKYYDISKISLDGITVTEEEDGIFNVDYFLHMELSRKDTGNESGADAVDEVNIGLRTQFDYEGNIIKQLYEAFYGYTDDISVILPDPESGSEEPVLTEPLFSDVSPEAWYYDACQYVGHRGIFNGMGDGTFAPGKQMTVAMFLQALANNTEGYEKGKYSGPDAGAWYDDAMNWACAVGLIDESDLSSASEPVTRERTAELMYRYAELTGRLDTGAQSSAFGQLSSYYQDASQIDTSAEDAVLWCTQRELMQGDGGFFRPSGILTRAQTAQLFQNAETLMENAVI